jgi:molybdopterin-guanine dinucleotide biosynthesis protein A
MGFTMDALILAGGENKRLKVTKGFLEINSKKIIESNVEKLKRLFDRVIISTDDPELYFYLGVPMVGDVVEHRGPMTGILSVLSIPEVSELFVTACDMPFIKSELIKYIVDKWSGRWDAIVPIFDNKPQPLLGIYSKRIAQNIEQSIKIGERSLRRFLHKIGVLYIEERDVRAIDPEGKSFVNINTIDDYLLITHRS